MHGGWSPESGLRNDLWVLSTSNMTWRCISPHYPKGSTPPDGTPAPRSHHQMLFVEPCNCMVLYGGYGNESGDCLGDICSYSFEQRRWTKIPTSVATGKEFPLGRAAFAATISADGNQIWFLGGHVKTHATAASKDILVLDCTRQTRFEWLYPVVVPAHLVFGTSSAPPTDRTASSTSTPSRLGGSTARSTAISATNFSSASSFRLAYSSSGDQRPSMLESTTILVPQPEEAPDNADLLELPCGLMGHGAVMLGSEPDRILVWGGTNEVGLTTSDVLSISLSRGRVSWIPAGTFAPAARSKHAMCPVSSTVFAIFGGSGFRDAWMWDITKMQWRCLSHQTQQQQQQTASAGRARGAHGDGDPIPDLSVECPVMHFVKGPLRFSAKGDSRPRKGDPHDNGRSSPLPPLHVAPSKSTGGAQNTSPEGSTDLLVVQGDRLVIFGGRTLRGASNSTFLLEILTAHGKAVEKLRAVARLIIERKHAGELSEEDHGDESSKTWKPPQRSAKYPTSPTSSSGRGHGQEPLVPQASLRARLLELLSPGPDVEAKQPSPSPVIREKRSPTRKLDIRGFRSRQPQSSPRSRRGEMDGEPDEDAVTANRQDPSSFWEDALNMTDEERLASMNVSPHRADRMRFETAGAERTFVRAGTRVDAKFAEELQATAEKMGSMVLRELVHPLARISPSSGPSAGGARSVDVQASGPLRPAHGPLPSDAEEDGTDLPAHPPPEDRGTSPGGLPSLAAKGRLTHPHRTIDASSLITGDVTSIVSNLMDAADRDPLVEEAIRTYVQSSIEIYNRPPSPSRGAGPATAARSQSPIYLEQMEALAEVARRRDRAAGEQEDDVYVTSWKHLVDFHRARRQQRTDRLRKYRHMANEMQRSKPAGDAGVDPAALSSLFPATDGAHLSPKARAVVLPAISPSLSPSNEAGMAKTSPSEKPRDGGRAPRTSPVLSKKALQQDESHESRAKRLEALRLEVNQIGAGNWNVKQDRQSLEEQVVFLPTARRRMYPEWLGGKAVKNPGDGWSMEELASMNNQNKKMILQQWELLRKSVETDRQWDTGRLAGSPDAHRQSRR